MVYLYSGLGILMLSGIMAIFEMGLALTGQSMLPIPSDPYLDSTNTKAEEMKVADRRFLELLTDKDTFKGNIGGISLCNALLESYTNKFSNDLSWTMDDSMPIGEGFWARSCILNRGSHRVLVKPADRGIGLIPYEFFSCFRVGGNEQCSFE